MTKEHLQVNSIPANGRGNYRIYYQQGLLKNRARYILTTTRKWGRPLEKAEFQLLVPSNICIDSCSYEPDSIEVKDKNRLCWWEKTHFMPDRDFVIIFSKD